MRKDDGDIIRGLGFVTLYSSYLEEGIDKILLSLNSLSTFDEKKQRWAISRKIKYCKKLLIKLNNHKFLELTKALDESRNLFEQRNEIIHGRIYANFDRPDILKSGRPNIPDREVTSSELYDLANNFFTMRSILLRPTIFDIPAEVNSYYKRKNV